MARPPTGMAASGTVLPSGARRNERRANEASKAEPMMNAQAITMSGAGPVWCTRLETICGPRIAPALPPAAT